jgi:hypothetical protein
MVVLRKYPNLGIVFVAVMNEVDRADTILGSPYGIPSGYMFKTKHHIDPSDLHNVETPAGATNTIYWNTWKTHRLTDQNLQILYAATK